MGKKKKFIDKKKSVTFHLVHRSQQDPLITDETAPQHVLVAANEAPQGAVGSSKPADKAKRKEDQKKFGIYFDDDYDYLQHLRDAGQQTVHWEPVEPRSKEKSKETESKLKLPSSVFASEFEEDEGLLRRAIQVKGPRPDWDPDIVEALDDDFDHENPDNALDDDFVMQAMQECDDSEEEEEGEWSDVDSNDADYSADEEDDDLGPLRGFGKEETKSRFTEYSMSSSVIRRNEQLSLLDDKFEKLFEQYDDIEVGALDAEDIQGSIDPTNSELLLKFATEFKREHKTVDYEKSFDIARLVKMQQEYESEPEEMIEIIVTDGEAEEINCETAQKISSNNKRNRPKTIMEPSKKKAISIDEKTGIPKDILGENTSKLTAKSLAKLAKDPEKNGPKSLCAESVISTLSILSIRPKDESLEEKKERKKLLKEYRSERRIERKANTLAFKEEKLRQDKVKANLRNNIQGMKLL